MTNDPNASLSVSIRDLTSVHVACIEYKATADRSDMHDKIGECFRRVQGWFRERDYDLNGLLRPNSVMDRSVFLTTGPKAAIMAVTGGDTTP